MALFRVVSEIFNVENVMTLKSGPGQRPLNVIESDTIRQTGYGFLLLLLLLLLLLWKSYTRYTDKNEKE